MSGYLKTSRDIFWVHLEFTKLFNIFHCLDHVSNVQPTMGEWETIVDYCMKEAYINFVM